eukprot:EG_transcript_18439
MSAKNLREMFQKRSFCRIVFVTAGFPEPNVTADVLLAIQASGVVECVEIGVPYTDPVGDGPVIAECGNIAMAKGTRHINQAMDMLQEARQRGFTLPCLLMGYANTFKAGWAARAKGLVDGVIVVDLPLEEPYTHTFIRECADNDISFVPILTPLTSPDRVKSIGQSMASSWVYCTSVVGVTGARDFMEKYFREEYGELFRSFKENTNKPCVVGFGVSSAATIDIIRSTLHADGVVVGSAFMKALQAAPADRLQEHVVEYLQGLYGEA